MSGDVQPRKRKDKKRKKDDLGIEEPRGTAAALGEGDVFMHSPHEHGAGGHWCAKIIFFSLLAILITLIGLIILENRGLSELEANAVESRYSGVLEGWLEDAPDDDHHDEHTLELTRHDDDDDEHRDDNQLEDEDHGDEDEAHDEDEDEEHDDDDDDDEDEEHDNDDEDEEHDDDDDDDEELSENDEDQDEDVDHDEERDVDIGEGEDDNEDNYEQQDSNEDERELDDDEDNEEPNFVDDNEDKEQEDDISDELNEQDDEDDQNEDENKYYDQYDVNENEERIDESNEIDDRYGYGVSNNNDDENEESPEDAKENEDEDEHDDEDGNDEDDVEVEQLEKEEPDEDPISLELPALPEDDDHNKDDDDDDNDDKHSDKEDGDFSEGESDQDDDEQFLENNDSDEPEVEHITALPGKPLVEVEEDESSEQPPDTLAEEEEYEKRQEELRREEEQSSHMWLKLTVGGALLAATHAVMRRATRSRDEPDDEEPASREETPLSDRRRTLIPEEHAKHVPVTKLVEEISRPSVDKIVESAASIIKPTLVKKQESEEEEEEKYSDEEEAQEIVISPGDTKELYSDEEEEADIDEEVVEEPKQIIKQSTHVVESKPEPIPDPEEEIEEDDVEIIDDEQLEEELEEEDEEEISDVDDAELLTRLEAKYGRLPEPERPGQKFYKDGGNSIEDDWPGEPSDAYWRGQLDSAERELLQGAWSAAAERVKGAPDCARARWIAARALDLAAETQRDNKLLSQAIAAYLHLLKMNERLSDKKLLQVAQRTLDRIQFRGNYLNAEPVYRLLIRRFPLEPTYRNNLTISFLMANRADLAEEVLKETLTQWPNDRLALAHYGFVLKTRHNRYEEAAEAFRKALEGDKGPANEARFYYHYGDSLLLLGRHAEAHEVHKRGAALGHFLSPAQRSLYNVPRLKSAPWWKIEDTPYIKLAKALEKSWREILKEAEAAKELYEKEKEGLKERGEWSQLDLFVRGREIPKRCERAPVTCSVVKSEVAAAGCRRGQVKFSAMEAGTHVRAHVGPTNCRLRMHLGLSNTKETYIRVDQEIRQWQEGKTFLFDDSFEHEVWHNGTGTRLVLIVDVWHPHLTAPERRQLPAI